MTSNNIPKLDADLHTLGARLDDSSFVPELMDRVSRTTMTAPRSKWTAWRQPLAIAASLALVAGVWLALMQPGGASLYAKAIEAIEEAETVHAVGQRWQDGQWVKTVEVIYERGAGVYECSQHRGKVNIRVIDGQHEWRFSPDEPTVRKGPARDLLGNVRKILAESRLIDRATRDATGDKVIDGDKCSFYAFTNEPGTARYRVWVDAKDRIREFHEQKFRDGQWHDDELSTVRYDVPVDGKRFVPQLPANARIIEAEKALDASFALDRAKYRQEAEGLVFAVHRVERLDNGWFFVVTSLRPSEPLHREIRNNDSGPLAHNYATLIMNSSFKRFADDPNRMRSYGMLTLARAYHDGLEVQWTLFEPTGAWELDPNVFDLSWRYASEGKLAEKLQAQGKPTWAEFKSVAQLPADPRNAGIDDVLGKTYDELATLEPIVARATLELQSIPFTDADMEEFYRRNPTEPRPPGRRMLHGRAEPPSRITKEAYQRDFAVRIKEVLDQRPKPRTT